MTYQFDSQAFVRRTEAAGMARAVAEELALRVPVRMGAMLAAIIAILGALITFK